MPERVASQSSQRFAALLDFQRDVDLMNPSHIGKNSGHQRPHHGGDVRQQNWSDSLSSFLSSTFRASKVAPTSPPRPCGVEAVVTRSQGHFSPQNFIRTVWKRALVSRDESVVNAKRARTRFDYVGYGSNHATEPMVLCG
jgi:hypothetical protein